MPKKLMKRGERGRVFERKQGRKGTVDTFELHPLKYTKSVIFVLEKFKINK